jgi:hypothetical protein
MSYTSITAAARDTALTDRITAAAYQEALDNPTFTDTVFGRQMLGGYGSAAPLNYPVAIDTEAAYESALAAGNPNPGGDPSVITDAAILSAVQAHWPPDPEPPT